MSILLFWNCIWKFEVCFSKFGLLLFGLIEFVSSKMSKTNKKKYPQNKSIVVQSFNWTIWTGITYVKKSASKHKVNISKRTAFDRSQHINRIKNVFFFIFLHLEGIRIVWGFFASIQCELTAVELKHTPKKKRHN